ncbi:MAG: hypothetical protein JW902_15955 [Syntrophaceae bacterium]|nr:hypothetical protein [Syntrophaceae bacterium]
MNNSKNNSMHCDELTKEIFKLMIDKGIKMRVHGDVPYLTKRLSEYLGETIHVSTLCNALSGYRTGKRSVQILNGLKGMLSEHGDYTHRKANCNG